MISPTATIIPTNPLDQKTILDAIKEADCALISAKGYRAQVKDIISELHEKFPDVGKKHFNKMLKTFHAQNFSAIAAESEDFSELYNTIFK